MDNIGIATGLVILSMWGEKRRKARQKPPPKPVPMVKVSDETRGAGASYKTPLYDDQPDTKPIPTSPPPAMKTTKK